MATNSQLSLNLGLSQLPETADPKLFSEMIKVYNAVRILASALDIYTGAIQRPQDEWNSLIPSQTIKLQNPSRLYVKFSENVSLGQVVNLYNNAGVLNARLASAVDTTKPVMAYCSTVGGVTVGNYGEVILFGLHPFYANLTPGALYYLSATAGSITSVVPANKQAVGYALSATELFFHPSVGF